MTERIVVSCRMSYSGVQLGRPRGYLERARSLTQRAEALGATLAAWSAVTLAFAWDTDSIDEAIALAVSLPEDANDETDAWACGIAQGELDALAPQGQRADLAWGVPLVAAVALARIARPGEVLLDASLEALRAGELMKLGSRVGRDSGRRVQGAKLDLRQPWKRDAAAKIGSLIDPPLFGRTGVVESLLAKPGVVSVVRANPGFGGTRLLEEVAKAIAPGPCLWVAPSGLGGEPLGALRCAVAQKGASSPLPPSLELGRTRLLAGAGTTLDAAGMLVAACLAGASKTVPAALLIDDATEVDAVTLEACARAMTRAVHPFVFVLRLQPGDPLPVSFSGLARGAEVELQPLDAKDGEDLALACTAGALSQDARPRWARRGGHSPLGILEAVACGLVTGELAWTADSAFGRRRLKGKGRTRPVSFWLVRRAEELPAEARAVLSALALLGGNATREVLDRVLRAVGAPVDASVVIPSLVKGRWMREYEPNSVALLTRSHRQAVLELLDEGRARAWHRAVAQSLETAGPLTRAEAAHHASKAGDGPWAARLALDAAEAASDSRLQGSAERLLAFARAEDPTSDAQIPAAVPLSAASIAPPAAAPPLSSIAPPGAYKLSSSPPSVLEEGEFPEAVAARLLDLTKAALLLGDARSLERWCNGLRATGEHDQLAERMRAMAHLSHGQVAHAGGVLQRAYNKLKEESALPSALCQGALALGVALAHAGQLNEALLSALDALARAREAKDTTGERACVTFLAKLFEGASREQEARTLRATAARAVP